MPLSDERRQELLKKLEPVYRQTLEFEQRLKTTEDGGQRAVIRQELEKCYRQLKQMEGELSGAFLHTEQNLIRQYLESLWRDLARLEQFSLPRQGSIPPGFELQKWWSFLKTETAQPVYSRQPPGGPVEPVRLEEMAGRQRLVMLVGPGGAGKSAALRGLLSQLGSPWLTQEIPDEEAANYTIPLLADLNGWDDQETRLLDFLQTTLRRQNGADLAERLPKLLQSGRVVLLLDNLDQLPRLERNPVSGKPADLRLGAIQRLAERSEWQKVGCVATAQEKLVRDDQGWQTVYLRNLTQDQLTAYAQAYSGDTSAADKFAAGMGESNTRRELARPFFMPMLLNYYQRRQNWPEGAVPLLQDYVNLNLNGSEAEKMQAQLARLAYELTLNEQWGGGEREKLAEKLYIFGRQAKAEKLWQAGAAGGWLLVGPERVEFSQRWWQEYFCALHCQGLPFEGQTLFKISGEAFKNVWRLWATLTKEDLTEKLLKLMAGSKSWHVKLACLRALSYLGDERAVPPLIELLRDDVISLRSEAVLTLAALGDRRAVEPLLPLLKDGVREVRLAAIRALGMLGDGRAVRPLLAAVPKDQDQWQQGGEAFLISEALAQLGSLAVFEMLESVKQGRPEWVSWITETLGKLGEAAIPALSEGLNRPDWQIRSVAAQALGKIQGEG